MTGAIYGALAKAQAKFPAIPRTKEVTVKSDKGSYKFKYAPLETILDAVRPALSENGLAVFHRIETNGKTELVAVLAHESGETIESRMPLALAGKMQEQGSELTYKKRYTIQSVLGVSSDDDDDANAADGNNIEQQTERGFKKPTLAPSPAEKKASEIEASFRAAKDAAALAKLGAENKAHIDAMSDALQDKLRGIYQECMNIVSPRKAA